MFHSDEMIACMIFCQPVSLPCIPSDEMIARMTFLFESSIVNWTTKAFGTCKKNKTCFKQVSILQYVRYRKLKESATHH